MLPSPQRCSLTAVCVDWVSACFTGNDEDMITCADLRSQAEESLTGGVPGRYHFITTTCAIIGGVFTVAGIVDGLVHTGARFAKKVELGKHT